jgi:hypothetical protein
MFGDEILVSLPAAFFFTPNKGADEVCFTKNFISEELQLRLFVVIDANKDCTIISK